MKMLELTRVMVSRKDSKPQKVFLLPKDFVRLEEHEDDRDPRITARVTYKVSEYQEQIMYVTDKITVLTRRIKQLS